MECSVFFLEKPEMAMTTEANSKEEVFRRVREARERLAVLGVTSLGIFGSFVRGEIRRFVQKMEKYYEIPCCAISI
jgi:hypothetical protein